MSRNLLASTEEQQPHVIVLAEIGLTWYLRSCVLAAPVLIAEDCNLEILEECVPNTLSVIVVLGYPALKRRKAHEALRCRGFGSSRTKREFQKCSTHFMLLSPHEFVVLGTRLVLGVGVSGSGVWTPME